MRIFPTRSHERAYLPPFSGFHRRTAASKTMSQALSPSLARVWTHTLGGRMSRMAKSVFFILTGAAIVATFEPLIMYTMSSIHVHAIDLFVASVCIAVVVFTIGVWHHRRWMLSPAVAGNLLFGTWHIYLLWGAVRGHNYMTLSCLIVRGLVALSPFASAVGLIVWGARYCEGAAQSEGPPSR